MTNLSLCVLNFAEKSASCNLSRPRFFDLPPLFSHTTEPLLRLMSEHHRASVNALPDEILLRVFNALIESAQSSWLDPTHARPDMLAEDELETAASLVRIARVSRRFCRLVDSFGWVIIDGEGCSRDVRKRPAKRLVVPVYDDVQLQETSLSEQWLKDGVVAATVVLQYPFQQDFPGQIHPFPVPELYGFALRELNLLGGETSCTEGSWLEP